MALIDMKSDLSWYGKNPGPYKAISNVKDTKFQGIDGTPFVETGGYESQGAAALAPLSRFAGDSFIIDTGTSSRKAQLGAGYKFPIGPEGQIHSFDKTRIGYTETSKYGDQYGVKFNNAGLGDTYTANSPIDDMYNKFNLRDDATPNSYIKHPLILRGIQRDGKSDPQRWGLNVGPGLSGAFDIPRGGILTTLNRTLIDVVRNAKFLVSPKGIGFIAKQVGYQLMNPYKETRLWNPLSLGSIAPIVHINRHFGAGGVLGGLVSKLAGDLSGDLHVGLRDDLFSKFDKDHQSKGGGIGSEIKKVSSKFGGPDSIFGIGGTSITRYEDTSLKTQLEGTTAGVLAALDLSNLFGGGNGGGTGKVEYHKYSYGSAYEKTQGESGVNTPDDIDNNNDALKVNYTAWPVINPDRGGKGTAGDGGAGGGTPQRAEGPIIDDYKRMAYGDIPTRTAPVGNKDAKQTNHIDFRDNGQSQALKIGWSGDKRIDEIDDSDDSLINFKIAGIKFKAYIGSLNDTFAGSWGGEADQGRADQRYLYESFERTITTDFIVPVLSKDDYDTVWGNLQKLAQKTYPVYGSSGFHGQTVKVTIGDMFKNKDMIITDLGYDWDNETPWEITKGKQAPLYTNVSISFTVLGSKPTSTSTVYSNV